MPVVDAGLTHEKVKLEGGSYEILQNRLNQQREKLFAQLEKLNQSRKEVFGAIETQLIATERISTDHNCIPYDMVPVGQQFIFGYNVHLGLKSEIELSDVFSMYEYQDRSFYRLSLELIENADFVRDFQKLYKYYKHTRFSRFTTAGPYLYMIFQVGKSASDIKAFKWGIKSNTLQYLDDRSDHEITFPAQHEFTWKRTTRDDQREGKFPHISIENRVFVETIGGDLTIKVEDNTDEGQGIYTEPVDEKDQTLDDAEIYYVILDHIILLKIKPYQEKDFRFLAYNEKLRTVRRIDAIKHACLLLPDDQGIIFSEGYYLQTGEFKQFESRLETRLETLVYEKKVTSPNGEDFLYVFYNQQNGVYLLLPYNLIEQTVKNPIVCHGYAIFENGELCYFNADNEPKKHHAIRIWQTPFTGPDFKLESHGESYLFKIGNKDIVRAMAECNAINSLIQKGDQYQDLYADLRKEATSILDSYHWLNHADAFLLSEPLKAIHETATAAIDEFEKVRKIRKNTEDQVKEVTQEADALINSLKREKPAHIYDFVNLLSRLRELLGKVLSLKELRYVDIALVENYEQKLNENTREVSRQCVQFLLREKALEPYHQQVQELDTSVEKVTKVVEAHQVETETDKTSAELEMLMETVSNLEIEDATETTRIIDAISAIFSSLNKVKASLKRKRQELLTQEGKAVFIAQSKLIQQALVNYLDISDTPEKCDEYAAKLLVQLEELEGKFSEFEAFSEKIAAQRYEVYNAFEAKKVLLIETKNKRANLLLQSANRVIKSIQSRVNSFKDVSELNGYFAADFMVNKIREIARELLTLGDTVKADDIQSRLKTTREDAVRQLKDKAELFVNGAGIIRFGNFQFSVNTSALGITTVVKDEQMYFHLTGTNFYELVSDPEITAHRVLWNQHLVSENQQVYRAEYLAFKILEAGGKRFNTADGNHLSTKELNNLPEKELLQYVQQFMAVRYQEGYIKGVHDFDASLILKGLVEILTTAGLLRYTAETRACATLFWKTFSREDQKQLFDDQIKGAGAILTAFPESDEFDNLLAALQKELVNFVRETGLFSETSVPQAATYLFHELTHDNDFVTDQQAVTIAEAFSKHIKETKSKEAFDNSISRFKNHPVLQFNLVRKWIRSFLKQTRQAAQLEYADEASVLLFYGDPDPAHKVAIAQSHEIPALRGTHAVIVEGKYQLHLHQFMDKLQQYDALTVPAFNRFSELKKALTQQFEADLRLNELKPIVMSSFVRNKLIDKIYLPLIGANLAKQIGTAGENKRTDRMGMLMLISPPGYGKTTLMEYIAHRLGIVFVKINGPAIGHKVTSVDPAEATNAAAREELEKLNLAFEMGDNVMIYVDDIQHCNPEFMQKFISLCDAQRKIEGVYKGKSRTYDFRGKKVCVVMAGNPYTESGEKFQVPDMLSNRADIYNLGDIIGDSAHEFKLSYLENALTSNPVLHQLAGKSQKDLYTFADIAATGMHDGIDFETNYSPEEISEYVAVLKKLLVVRDTVLAVNSEYIRSAGQADMYRTEPAFKLQGSYRDMNKLAEKVMPLMNEKELQTLIMTHYENEAQTLTTGAEANLLKFKEMTKQMTDNEKTRWTQIKNIFAEQQQMKGYGEHQVGQAIAKIGNTLVQSLEGIKEALNKEK